MKGLGILVKRWDWRLRAYGLGLGVKGIMTMVYDFGCLSSREGCSIRDSESKAVGVEKTTGVHRLLVVISKFRGGSQASLSHVAGCSTSSKKCVHNFYLNPER